ncbi:hypothetical protein N5P37_001832 [Trichoderma harzianum]|uniref:Uncharacterized protein n=1 Tax=Trichoderma harzianum CBS 226.95 TaxID=983964 RepID=A0A2T4APW7_TRIHA|nr:hypothetical protein M431DRAFT_1759 [Trichoderma harzianum CBS 226.95]KAK0765892.1 hypothetical protein N5P37_001832 [Trichoderma harzianum]PKK49743.1 hypothetical protein CI102_3941 [Trichoderma harzianum]PTB59107.1 hypothetical protein M431DRAFT_1759 [Trichoderma harzianum CBS 226.95]
MAENNTPFVSEDWHEEFDNLNTFKRGVASTSSSVYGNDDSGDEDSSDYASDDSRHDDGYASEHSSADELNLNALGITGLSNSGPSSKYSSSRPSSRDSNSVAGSEISNEQVLDNAPLLGGFPFLPDFPEEFVNLFKIVNRESVPGALSVDMVAELGIILILPPRFVRPGMITRPYDATQSPGEGFRLSMAFAPNGKITGELADAAFAIEIHDAEKYQGSIGNGRRWETVKHMLEEMRASLYPSRESDE